MSQKLKKKVAKKTSRKVVKKAIKKVTKPAKKSVRNARKIAKKAVLKVVKKTNADNQSKVNDFVIRFANVNGTGSASANFLFTKAIFRMGIPVTPKNIFPSNIQGLPTWYEVRISEKGYLGRREGIDLMVAVNPQSMKKDYADTREGGYFVYDSTKPLPPGYERTDLTHLGIPM